MANPSAEEQYMLELVNRMRMNPAAEENLLVNSDDPNVDSALDFFNVDLNILNSQWANLTPVQPVAWSSLLEDSATTHSELMIVQDTQSHQLPGEPSLGDRVNAIGYSWNAVGENIFAFSESIFHGHAALAIDWGNTPTGIQQPPGHRENMMNNNFREVGIAVVPEDNPATNVGPLVITQVFGNRAALENGNESWLLGYAIRDVDDDNFYSIGEGLDDVTLNITGTGTTSFSGSTNTLSAGGYQILLADGDYQVDFVRDGAIFQTNNVTINGENEKVDAIIDAAPAPAAGKAKIVGNKWNDLNGDGIWDSNEAGLSDWTIYLDTNGNRQLDAGEVSTTTDANGEYVFNDLDPGTYNVAEVLQSGWVQTNPDPSNPIGSEAYQLDDGELDTYRGGFNSGGTPLEFIALNTFDTQTGLETIDSISVGNGTNGNPSKVFIYNDPDNDGNPDDAVKLTEVNTSFTGTSGFGLVSLTTPVTVSGTFFVGALYAGGEFAPVDQDTNAGKSSFIPGFSSGIDTDNLSNNFSESPVTGNLLLRANSPGALPNIVTVAADETITNINFGNQEVSGNAVDGTADRDTLVGTSVSDEITGYQGGDTLTGNAGEDLFIYTSVRDAGDVITDFTVGEDKIVLTDLFASFGISTNYSDATTVDNYLSFGTQGADSTIFFDSDGSGAGRAMPFILVQGVSNTDLNQASNFTL